jgi:hypothetical protein
MERIVDKKALPATFLIEKRLRKPSPSPEVSYQNVGMKPSAAVLLVRLPQSNLLISLESHGMELL